MATDGTKIIDGDRAHDTYWGIMDQYDAKAPMTVIIEEFPLEGRDALDDFDHEIYVTSCGLAYWELGLMTPERLDYIKTVIAKDACVNNWGVHSEKMAKSRKTVLKRYLTKISKENTKVRPRKKYPKVRVFAFGEDTVLAFQLENGKYCAALCAAIQQYRGECTYWLVPTTYYRAERPTLDAILQESLLMTNIGSMFSREETLAQQPSVAAIWEHTKSPKKFLVGLVIDGMLHPDVLKAKAHFEPIGKLPIEKDLKRVGSLGASNGFQDLAQRYQRLHESTGRQHYKRYPIALLLEKSAD